MTHGKSSMYASLVHAAGQTLTADAPRFVDYFMRNK